MSAPQSEAFKTAQKEVGQLTEKPTNDEFLELYALFKIGSGFDFAAASKPGFLDIQGKYKYNAWEAKSKEGLSPEAAQEAYVVLVERLKVDYKFDPTKVPEKAKN